MSTLLNYTFYWDRLRMLFYGLYGGGLRELGFIFVLLFELGLGFRFIFKLLNPPAYKLFSCLLLGV